MGKANKAVQAGKGTGAPHKARFVLTEEEREALTRVLETDAGDSDEVLLSRVVLLAADGLGKGTIARRLGLNKNRVATVLTAFELAKAVSEHADSMLLQTAEGRFAMDDVLYLKRVAEQRPDVYPGGADRRLWSPELLAARVRSRCGRDGHPALSLVTGAAVSAILNDPDIRALGWDVPVEGVSGATKTRTVRPEPKLEEERPAPAVQAAPAAPQSLPDPKQPGDEAVRLLCLRTGRRMRLGKGSKQASILLQMGLDLDAGQLVASPFFGHVSALPASDAARFVQHACEAYPGRNILFLENAVPLPRTSVANPSVRGRCTTASLEGREARAALRRGEKLVARMESGLKELSAESEEALEEQVMALAAAVSRELAC